MNKTTFLMLAKERGILYVQTRARAFRLSETHIELWSIFYNLNKDLTI